ncbi:hypothetical protein SASPL_108412 [Salvia splendens]|uniref:RanBP2-type domain-containing protein n=1 Tax=Salvia splendens TaxID=180675 RepID=A0A8X9A671_SALSN|nr:hypothetical protein SASPL_108412 [Salvia splendens]
MALSHLLLRRLNCSKPPSIHLLSKIPIPNSLHFSSASADPASTPQSPSPAKPTSLSARMSFIFEQIDEIDKNRQEKDQTLQRIRAWRESKKHKDAPVAEATPHPPPVDSVQEGLESELAKSEAFLGSSDGKKEVELVHPWSEWIELMERLLHQNYFDHKRKDEDGMMQALGFDVSAPAAKEDKRPNFARDFKTVQGALVNFGRDRFDILRSLSRQDLQLLVGYGCPTPDKRVVYSAKLLRKYVHLDEGDVCSSCSLRGSCEKAYLLTNKEDEARTMDVMRMLLAYGFDPIDGSVENRSLLKMKSVKTIVRKLLHDVVKLSAVPIDPNLPPPVIKKPPPKVKQPPPPPKRRVGRDDIEMKKGDWLCPKCDFMNFAKNTVCLQCDAKRPKRQLLPGEWECPQYFSLSLSLLVTDALLQCNFLNYRRNTDCFHCEHKRPPDTYPENHFSEKQHGSHIRMDKKPARADVSNAWNFDFDDNESDGADVAAFEYADSQKLDEDFPLSQRTPRESSRGQGNGPERSRPPTPRGMGMDYSDSTSTRSSVGFNDFDEDDDDDVDSYELVAQNEVHRAPRVALSELEADSDSEDLENSEGNRNIHGKAKSPARGRKLMNRQTFSDSEAEVDFYTDDDLPVHPKWKSSHVADVKHQRRGRNSMAYGSDDDFEVDSGSDGEDIRNNNRANRRGSNRLEFRNTRGGRSNFNDSFTERDEDGDLSYMSDRQRDRRGQDRPGQSSRGRGGMMGDRKGSQGRDFGRSSSAKSFDRSSREDSYGGGGKNARDGNSSKFQSNRRGLVMLVVKLNA